MSLGSNLAVFSKERGPAWSTEVNTVAFLRGCLFNMITFLGRPVARLTVKQEQILYLYLFRISAFYFYFTEDSTKCVAFI